MALLFVDGFSHYTQAFLAQKWDVVNNFGTSECQLVQSKDTVGRFNGGGVVFTGLDAGLTTQRGQYMQKNYDGVSTIICGFAFKQSGTQQSSGGRMLTFMDGNTVQAAFNVLQSGQLRLLRSTSINGGYDGFGSSPSPAAQELTTVAESVSAISSSSFDFLEFKIVHHPSAGSIEVRRNGSAFWTLGSLNTAFSGVSSSSSVLVGGYQTDIFGATIRHYLRGTVTDFYLLNTTVNGSDALDPVDFIGDRHWEPITPTADGADTAWTITGSASHFANVDEVPPNTTDYNSTTTLNARDGFVVSSPTGPSTASALLAFTMYIQKNTGGSNAVKGFMRSGAAVYRNGTEFQVPTPWAFRQSFMATRPAGGAITIADVGNHQLGYEKTV